MLKISTNRLCNDPAKEGDKKEMLNWKLCLGRNLKDCRNKQEIIIKKKTKKNPHTSLYRDNDCHSRRKLQQMKWLNRIRIEMIKRFKEIECEIDLKTNLNVICNLQ